MSRRSVGRAPINGADRGAIGSGILELQRARISSAAVGLLAEQGHRACSVAAICARAGVSRRTYYEVFDNRDACLTAILVDAEARARRAIGEAHSADGSWRERIRGWLWAILCLADGEPALARVCLVELQHAGETVGAERARMLSGLVEVIDAGRGEGRSAAAAGALTAEALVGAVVAVLVARISDLPLAPEAVGVGLAPSSHRGAEDHRDGGEGHAHGDGTGRVQLRGLLGELMSMIVLPYLGPAAARRELQRPLPSAPASEPRQPDESAYGRDPLAGMPMRLTYRTGRVLLAVAVLGDASGGASNRRIAEHAGVADQGQISKLLTRLEHHGLLSNAAKGAESRGEANSWSLTGAGRQLVRGIGSSGGSEARNTA
ncbi:MAG TPA: TetR/AcrR family transcriptional regulator [Solirubrobacteraceae bacterium]